MTDNVEDIIRSDPELRDLQEQFEVDKEIAVENEEQTKKDCLDVLEYNNYDAPDKVIPSSLLLKKLDIIGNKTKTYTTGFYKFDDITGGFDEEELVVLSGITGNGKTLFARTLTYKFALNTESPCLWFSYEESPLSLLQKFHRNNVPLFYLPKKNVDTQMSWIEKRIIESSVKYKTKIVFIDHLHFLIPMKFVLNTSILIGGIMRELKKICVRNKVVIFIIAHTQKVAQTEVPDLSQVRDSSFIAQESDKVIFIKRHGRKVEDRMEFDNNNSVYVLKNRKNGKLGTIPFYYNFEEGMLNEGSATA